MSHWLNLHRKDVHFDLDCVDVVVVISIESDIAFSLCPASPTVGVEQAIINTKSYQRILLLM